MLWWNLIKLKSKDPKIRRLAIDQLAQSEYNDVIEHLKMLSNDSDIDVRCKVLETLAKYQEPKSTPIFLSLIRDSSDKVRELAIAALASHEPRQHLTHLISALKDTAANVRWRAAKVLDDLGWIPGTEAEKAAKLVALGDYDKAVECGNAALEPLLAELNKDNVYYKRQAAVGAISRLSDPRVPKALLGALNDPDAGVRSSAIEALAHLGDTRAVEPLIKALKTSDTNVRVRAIDALGKMDDARAIDPICQFLKDSSWEVRNTAVNALGNLKAASMIQPITVLLKDSDNEVKESAIKALLKMGDLRVIEFLVPVLADPHDNVRKLASKALLKLNPEWQMSDNARKAIPELKNATKHNDHKVRKAAAAALAEMGEEMPVDQALVGLIEQKAKRQTAQDVLVALLNDSDVIIRIAAVEAIGRLTDKRLGKSLEPMLKDPMEFIGRAAACSLTAIGWQPESEVLRERMSQLLAK